MKAFVLGVPSNKSNTGNAKFKNTKILIVTCLFFKCLSELGMLDLYNGIVYVMCH